jgi:hypothetical protein
MKGKLKMVAMAIWVVSFYVCVLAICNVIGWLTRLGIWLWLAMPKQRAATLALEEWEATKEERAENMRQALQKTDRARHLLRNVERCVEWVGAAGALEVKRASET